MGLGMWQYRASRATGYGYILTIKNSQITVLTKFGENGFVNFFLKNMSSLVSVGIGHIANQIFTHIISILLSPNQKYSMSIVCFARELIKTTKQFYKSQVMLIILLVVLLLCTLVHKVSLQVTFNPIRKTSLL